jgi:Fe-S cluster assembly protein SufD
VLPLDQTTQRRVTGAFDGTVGDRAERGAAEFETLPMPSEKDEAWRYVDVTVDLDGFRIAVEPGSPLAASQVAGALSGETGRALNVDGHTLEAQGSDGISVRPYREARVDLGFGGPSDRFGALHDAFSFDGVTVEAPAGASGMAIVEVQAVTSGVVAVPRLAISAGEGAALAVVVIQRSPDGIAALVVPSFEIAADAAAQVGVTVVQEWGDTTVAVARHRMRAGRDAHLGLSEAGFGGYYSRLHLAVDLEGAGAGARIDGVYFGDENQTLDYRYFIRHAARSTTSEMFLKGAVADDARSVFSGLIRIEKEGQKANAHQTNRNLVLSDGAQAHSVPNLEILADDVRCGHGSAVGPLDEEQRYYLMSRGLDPGRADRLQVKGFFEEALIRFPHRGLDAFLRSVAMAKYAGVVAS